MSEKAPDWYKPEPEPSLEDALRHAQTFGGDTHHGRFLLRLAREVHARAAAPASEWRPIERPQGENKPGRDRPCPTHLCRWPKCGGVGKCYDGWNESNSPRRAAPQAAVRALAHADDARLVERLRTTRIGAETSAATKLLREAASRLAALMGKDK